MRKPYLGNKHPWYRYRDSLIEARFRAGESVYNIADTWHVSVNTIYKVLRARGIL